MVPVIRVERGERRNPSNGTGIVDANIEPAKTLKGNVHELRMRLGEGDVTGNGSNRPASLPDLGSGMFERIRTPCIKDESSTLFGKSRAVASPMPDGAPVMIATLS